VSFHTAWKQSVSLNERQRLTELRVIYTTAGELGQLTCQSCGLTLMYLNWLQEVGTMFGWLHVFRTLKIKTFLYMLQWHWKDLKNIHFLNECACVCMRACVCVPAHVQEEGVIYNRHCDVVRVLLAQSENMLSLTFLVMSFCTNFLGLSINRHN
jgi:hypothetical protein